MKKHYIFISVALVALLMLVLVDPINVVKLPFTIPVTIIALINISSFSVLGFIMINILTDSYMDNEYKNSDDGHIRIARSIHILALSLILCTLIYVFYS